MENKKMIRSIIISFVFVLVSFLGISFFSLNRITASAGEESTYKFKVCTFTFFGDCDPLSHRTAIEFKYYDVTEGEWISPYSFHANGRYVVGSYYQPKIERTYFAYAGTQLKFTKRSRGENQFRMSKFNGNYRTYPSQANLYTSNETFTLEEGIYIIHYNYTRGDYDGKFDFFEFIQIVVGNHEPMVTFSNNNDKIYAESFDVDVSLSSNTALDVNACGYYWSSNPNLNPNYITFNNCKYNVNSDYSNYYLWTDLGVKITTPSNLNSGEYYLYFRGRTFLNEGKSNYIYSVSEAFKVDKDAPSASIEVSNSKPTNQSVSVTYSCEDTGGSGLASCGLYDFDTLIHEVSEGNSATYEFDSEKYDKFITYYLRVKASDNAGNTYVSDYNTLRVDYIKPSIVSVTPDTIGGGNDLVRIPEVSVDITVSDSGIGIDKTYYKWTDNENEVEDFIAYKVGNNFTLEHSTHGVRYLHLKTYDKAGNYSYEYYGPYHIDSLGAIIEMYDQHPSASVSGPRDVIYTTKEYITIYFVVTASRDRKLIDSPPYRATEVSLGDIKCDISACRSSEFTFEKLPHPDYQALYKYDIKLLDNVNNIRFGQWETQGAAQIYSSKNFIVISDNVVPNMPEFELSETNWTNKDVEVTYSCKGDNEGGSGLTSCNLYQNNHLIHTGDIDGVNKVVISEYTPDLKVIATDRALNSVATSSKDAMVDKNVKTVEFNKNDTSKVEFKINNTDKDLSKLTVLEIYINDTLINATIPSDDEFYTYYNFEYYGDYEVRVVNKDQAGNTFDDTYNIAYQNPNFVLDSLIVSYGNDGNSYSSNLISSENMLSVQVRNDGNTSSFISIDSTKKLFDNAFGVIDYENTTIKYKLNGEVRELKEGRIEIPSITSCLNTSSTCVREDDLTLVLVNKGIEVRKIVNVKVSDIRPTFIGEVTSSFVVAVNKEFTLEQLVFDVYEDDSYQNDLSEVVIQTIITLDGEVVDAIDTNKLGTYVITTTLTDKYGVTSLPCVRTLVVSDAIPPIISLIGETTIRVKVGGNYDDEGVNVKSIDGSKIIYSEDVVDYNKSGTYKITYKYIDSYGNESEVITRTIIVQTINPIIYVIAGITVFLLGAGVIYFIRRPRIKF